MDGSARVLLWLLLFRLLKAIVLKITNVVCRACRWCVELKEAAAMDIGGLSRQGGATLAAYSREDPELKSLVRLSAEWPKSFEECAATLVV